MIKPLPISGFYENLPDAQILEDSFKNIIKRNYSLSGFDSIETPLVERLEILTSKGGDDNEIYALHRLSGEQLDDSCLGLRFDLTVPLARYIAQYEGVLTFPFKRQHIAKVYRGERPQKGRYREFYQADVDIIGNVKLPLFADVDVLSTIYNALLELKFGDFILHINNKKLLQGFLNSIKVEKIIETISVIDKKDKVRTIEPMLSSLKLDENQIQSILEYIKIGEDKTSEEILKYFEKIDNELLKEGIEELNYVYTNLLSLGIDKKFIKINPAISRGLNYYTGTVFETFISGAEKMGSIASGGRYENLCSNFSKNNHPGVGGSIGVSRLIAVLNNLGKIKNRRKTKTQIMLVNTLDSSLKDKLSIIKKLRDAGVNSEMYLDSNTKMSKQIKYANNKKIPLIIIIGKNNNKGKKQILFLKRLADGDQRQLLLKSIIYRLKK